MTLPIFPHFDYAESVQNAAQRWTRWLGKFETMLCAMDISDQKRKRALLKHYMGDEVLDIFETLSDTGDGYDSATEALNNHFGSQLNTSYEIFKFRKTEQQHQENLDQFTTRLKSLALTCNFSDPDLEVRNQIILTGRSNKLRRFAMQQPEAGLEVILKQGRAYETTDRHVAELETSSKTNVNAIQNVNTKRTFPKHRENFKPNTPQKTKTCKFCAEEWHQKGLRYCKAQGKRCNLCNKLNHLAKACLSKQESRNTGQTNKRYHRTSSQQDNTNTLQHDSDSDSSTSFILSAFTVGSTTPKHENLILTFNNTRVSFIIDTGATVNVISRHELANFYKSATLTKSSTRLFAYGSKIPLKLAGCITLSTTFRERDHEITFIVTEDIGPALIGKSTALELGVISFTNQISNPSSETKDMINKHASLFKGLGKLNTTKVTLQIDNSVKPSVQKLRRIPFHLRKKIEKEIADLIEQDIIEPVPSNTPTSWISPIVPVPKRNDPDTVRICIDMKKANKAIKCEKCITPTIAEVTYQLNGAKHFSKLDLNKGYHQLELDETSRYITTFITHKGLFRYKRLHFGVNTAADIFQHEIMKLIIGIPCSLNVSDDILIFGRTQQEHDTTLEKVLDKLETAGLTLNKAKCSFNQTIIKFLGNIFTKDGIAPDPERTSSIAKMVEPRNPTEVRSLLGTINFCAKHMPHLAITAKPLRNLTMHQVKWEWKKEHQEAFEKLKQQITETTCLAYFDHNRNTEIWTDAGPEGLGAILIQRDKGGTPHTIAFASHALSETEQKYSQIEKEALAIIWATKHFHLYVFGNKFKIITDHKPLLQLFNNSNVTLSSRLERWKVKLMPYDYEIDFKPGKSNPADYLSCHPNTKNGEATPFTKAAERYMNFIANETTPRTLTIQEIQQSTQRDKILNKVIKSLCSENWKHDDLNHDENLKVMNFSKIKHELATTAERNILLRGARIVIPKELQERVIKIAHRGHQGITKTKDLLKEKVWFQGIDRMVEREIEQCISCRASSANPGKHLPTMSEVPEGPWRTLNIDHKGPLHSGEYLLVVIDQYTKFPVVEKVKSTTSKENIMKLDQIFATFGIPETIITDNGSPFNSDPLKKFVTSLNINHRRIIPRWPQANGQVESFNKVLNKSISIALANNEDWWHQLQTTLRDYRETPHRTTGRSPSSLLFAYKTKSLLPDASQIKHPTDREAVKHKADQSKRTCLESLKKQRIQNQPTPEVGDIVIVKQPQKSKLDQPFCRTPYEVCKTKGSMITASNKKHDITRHESHFKVIPHRETMDTLPSNIERTTQDKDNPGVRPTENTPDPPHSKEVNPENHLITAPALNKRYHFRENRAPPKRLIQEM